MTFPENIVDGYINEVVRPLGTAVANTVLHPIETLQNCGSAAIDIAQSHPYALATVIGLGAFAMYRGNLKFENNKMHLRFNFDTPFGACNWNTSHRIGPKLK